MRLSTCLSLLLAIGARAESPEMVLSSTGQVIARVFNLLQIRLIEVKVALDQLDGTNIQLLDRAWDDFFTTLQHGTDEVTKQTGTLTAHDMTGLAEDIVSFTNDMESLVEGRFAKSKAKLAEIEENGHCSKFRAVAERSRQTKDAFVAVFLDRIPQELSMAAMTYRKKWDHLIDVLNWRYAAGNCTDKAA
ncbi:hypothetical protein XA68_10163 [Ophiocordyceps unilateralis]|uniref:Uncharacterized protein n=1 Tax=Ophiocordyceps unilateralis TaxID=268505 RepID=A0A2A9PJ86_OPHUN|nr:hypothetical protein XA68_10163 [Ophiocordyceps unilateralis]